MSEPLGSRDFTLTRRAAASNVGGKITPGADDPVPIRGSLQPAPGDVLEAFDNADRIAGVFLFMTSAKLSPSSTKDGTTADTITDPDDGAVYEVRAVERPVILGLYEATVVKAGT